MAHGQVAGVLRHLRRWASEPDSRLPSDQELIERFLGHHEQAAFERLVERHGPMVLRVCRRVLRDEHAAEDAFQATFLVLVRKAATIGKHERLAPWLYRVAFRIAVRARTAAIQRHDREARAEPGSRAGPLAEAAARELCAILHEEIDGLPERYQGPFLLCYIEGLTRDQAAHQIGLSLRTLQRRLEQGRELLRGRLTRRGVTLSAALLTAGFSSTPAQAVVPATLLSSTVQGAMRFAARLPTAGEISARVTALAEKALAGMAMSRTMLPAAMLVLAMAVAGAGLVIYQAVANAPQVNEQPPTLVQGPSKPEAEVQARTDRYGDPLPAEAFTRLGTLRFRNGKYFDSLAYTPDGRFLISGGDGGARIWDAVSGKELGRFGSELRQAFGPAQLSPDGKFVAVGGWDEKDKNGAVYEVATGRRVSQFGWWSSQMISAAAFSPDGRILATHNLGAKIHLFNAATGALLHTLPSRDHYTMTVAFSSDGKTLIAPGPDDTIRFWDVATGKEARRIISAGEVVLIALSPDGSRLASVGRTRLVNGNQSVMFHNDRLIIWDVATGKELIRLMIPTTETSEGHALGPNFITFSPDGKGLLTGGSDGVLAVWDVATGKELRRFADHRGGLGAIAFAPQGKAVAIADAGKMVRVRDLESGRDLLQLGGHRGTILAAAVSPDGREIATAGADRAIYLWDAATGRERRQLPGHLNIFGSLLYSPDGRTLFFGSDDQTLRAYDPASGRELRRSDGLKGAGRVLALALDGKILAVPGPEHAILLVDAATGRTLRTLKGAKERIVSACFTSDGGKLVAWTGDDSVHFWDVASGNHLRELSAGFDDAGNAVAFSPDGRLVALGGQNFIQLVDVDTGQEVRRFATQYELEHQGVGCLTFSPDGRSLAWGGSARTTVWLGEVATGRERHRFVGGTGGVSCLAFSADGKVLVSGLEDTTGIVWDLMGRLGAGNGQSTTLSEAELNARWEDLGNDDPARAYLAMRRLTADPPHSVALIKQRLRPTTEANRQRVERLIADLDSDTFAARRRSTAELEKLGDVVDGALRKALAGRPSLEARQRIQSLLTKLAEWKGDRVRALRAVEVLEWIGDVRARQLLEELARGASDAWLTREARASLSRLKKQSTTKDAMSSNVGNKDS